MPLLGRACLMRWPWQAREAPSSTSETALDEAARSLAAILSAAPSETRPPALQPRQQKKEKQHTKMRWWRLWSSLPEQTSNANETSTQASSTRTGRDTPPAMSAAASDEESDCARLPPCPVAGYVLHRTGLQDTTHTPPHTLSRVELRELIGDVTALAEQARYDVDSTMMELEPQRNVATATYVPTVCFSLTALYVLTWQVRHCYRNALPRQSFLLRHSRSYDWLRRRCLTSGPRISGSKTSYDDVPDRTAHAARLQRANEAQFVARRYTTLLRMTNVSVMACGVGGVGLLALAAALLPGRPVHAGTSSEPSHATLTPSALAAAQQRHFEHTLKWLWYVYYHHPMYLVPPPVSS